MTHLSSVLEVIEHPCLMTDHAPQHLPYSWKEVPPFAYARTAVLCASRSLLSDNSAFCHSGFILRCLRRILSSSMLLLEPWQGERGCHSRSAVPHGRANCISGSLPGDSCNLSRKDRGPFYPGLFHVSDGKKGKSWLQETERNGFSNPQNAINSSKAYYGEFHVIKYFDVQWKSVSSPCSLFVCFGGRMWYFFCVEFEIIYAHYIYNYDIYKQKRTRFLDSAVGFFCLFFATFHFNDLYRQCLILLIYMKLCQLFYFIFKIYIYIL